MFGNSRPLFGGTNTSSSTFGSTGNVFGGTAQQQQPTGFGNTNQTGFGTMGSNANNSLFGNAGAQQTGSIFGRNVNTAQPTSFGMGSGNTNLFGTNNNSGGAATANTNSVSPFGMNRPTSGGLFGNTNTGNTGASIFGQQQNRPTGIFGATNSNTTGNAFQSNVNQQPAGGGLFGQQPAGSLFGNRTNTGTGTGFGGGGTQGFSGFNTSTNANNNNNSNNTGLFGRQNNSTLGSGGGLFGQSQPQQQNTGSLFGNRPASTGSGLFGQGQQQVTSGSLFGQNQGQNSGTGFFGSNNTVGGTGFFGQNNTNANNNTLQPAGSIFGQKNPMQQNQQGLFGQNTNQQTQSNSLFGNKPTGSGGLFGNTNTGNTGFFNNNQQQQQQGGGLFGQKPGTGLFGNTNTGSSLNFNTGFGNNMAQNNQTTGGLFGQKPAFGSGATGGSLFGNTNTGGNTNNAFGGTSGGLFGNNPNNNNNTTASTSGGLFGSQPTGTTSSLFGNTQGTTSSGLFGSKPSGGTTFGSTQSGGLFGNSNAQGSGATGGLFGNKTLNGPTGTGTSMPTTGGLFGNTANKPSTGTTGFSFGTANNTTASKPFGSGLTSGTATTATTGSGSSSGGLFGNKLGQSTGGLFGSNKTQTSLGSTNNNFAQNNAAVPATNNVLGSITAALQNKPAENLFTKVQISEAITKPESSFKLYTDSSRKTPRGLSATLKPTSRILLSRTDSALSTVKSPFSISEGVVGKHWRDSKQGAFLGASSVLTERTDSVPVKLLFNPDRASFKTLVIRKQNRQKSDVSLETESRSSQIDQISFSKNSGTTTQLADSKENRATPQRTLALSDVTNKALKGGDSLTENEKVELVKIPKVLSDDVSFLPNDYYTSPAMDTLESKSLLDLRKVSNLVVGHKDYGKIEFLDPVDLSNTPLKLLCGTIIVFEPRACLVYPTSTTRPKKGEGINVKARITVYNCFPLNKATGEPIKDPNHPMIKRHIAMLKKDIDGNKHFESYDPVTGTYVFVVGGPVIA